MKNSQNISSQLMDRSYQLLRASVNSSDLNDLADCAAKILGNPIIFLDTSYNIVGHSDNKDIEDKAWNESIALGYLSNEVTKEVIRRYRKFYIKISTNNPFEAVLKSSRYKWVVSNSYFKRHFCGTFDMLCVNEFNMESEIDINTIKIVSDMFAKSMISNENNSMNDIVPYEDVFKDLINGNIKNKILLKNIIVNTELEHVKNFVLISIYFEVFVHSIVTAFRNKLKFIFYHSWIFYHEDCLLILIEKNRILEKWDKEYMELDGLLRIFSAKACVSDKFEDLSYLYDYYQKNKRAIKFSKELKNPEVLISYSQYKFWDMVNAAVKSMPRKDIKQFVDERILKIREYDKINDTNYFITLMTFLSNNKSYVLTASKLYAHKNTIIYRISRLKEMYDLNFEDQETIFSLYYSCMIMDIYDKYN